jgi:sugar phosphate isomerase/epimerase
LRRLLMDHSSFDRRTFLKTIGAVAASAGVAGRLSGQGQKDTDVTLLTKARPKIQFGLDNFAVRAMNWKAAQLLDYAASQKLDTLFISDLDAFESLEEKHLHEIKAKAAGLKIDLYVGTWSICPSSTRFKKNWGTAEEHLITGIRVAKTVGSPVLRVLLGSAEDRKTEGGIRARIADTVKVLKACESKARDSGIKIAVENHAGDMHLDSGNAAWTLEDPHDVLERLGRYTICSSLRDNMIWETPDGAAVAWTAAGEGLIDWKKWISRWSELCPAVPIQIETISGFFRNFPYKKEEFWASYDKRPDALAKFEALAKRGRPIPAFRAEGADKKRAEQEYQKGEVERSFAYLRSAAVSGGGANGSGK